MIRNRKLLRVAAVFFVVEILTNTVSPAISYALTAGPTAPEATSFEPVDTTDMVNLATGDLTYNLPLLEVPGPSGGYPLSLSYHAGIQPGLEASWVGLGFSLNPGALNRSVSGYADDFDNVLGSDRIFWEGGSTTTYTVGLSVGYGGLSGGSAGLIISNDTYKGFGVGHYYGVSVGGRVGPANIGISMSGGVGPYGNSFSSTGFKIGIGASIGDAQASASVGITIDQDSNIKSGSSASVSYTPPSIDPYLGDNSALSASISSKTKGVQASVGGFSSEKTVNNSKSGKISTSGYDRQIDIPTPYGYTFHLGKSYQRYWMDETANVGTFGSLHFPLVTNPSSSELDSKAFDVYDLADIGPLPLVNGGTSTPRPPDESLAGTFIDYDSYQVLAQGVSGSIRPHHYQAYSLRQNKSVEKDGATEYRVKSYPLGLNKKPLFRFVGDFSNRYVHGIENDNYAFSSSGTPVSFSFDPNRLTGENGNDGFDQQTFSLPGSRKVEAYTNSQITNKEVLGYLDCVAPGFTRYENSKIGGFKITNESGVSYYYSLPVYSKNEYTFSGKKDEQNKWNFNSYKKTEPYAYTWLLTSVVGPDYVDANENGLADQGDWGYWVAFDYGKWSSQYGWRNPGTGFNKDIDQNFDNFSKGEKEIYYLNSIRTETHTAFFIKELRLDGKGVVHQIGNNVVNIDSDHNVTYIDNGSYDRIKTSSTYPNYDNNVSTLRLNSIYIIQNSDMEGDETSIVPTLGTVYFHPTGDQSFDAGKRTLSKNILDIHDVEANPEFNQLLKSKCLKKIVFGFDYSLCDQTPNSYLSPLDVLNTNDSPSSAKTGKLTLKSLKVLGRGEADLIPPTRFVYEEDEEFFADFTIVGEVSRLKISNMELHDFEKGEIITYKRNGTDYYYYITQVFALSGEIDIKLIEGSPSESRPPANLRFTKTKNPPYCEKCFDLWGFYKSDFSDFDGKSENEKRMVTSISKKGVDVWSLRQIVSPLGAKINIEYEPDQYKNALKSLANIPIRSIQSIGDRTEFTLFENLSEYGIVEGTQIKARFVAAVRMGMKDPENDDFRFKCNGGYHTYIYFWKTHDLTSGWSYDASITSSNSFTINYNYKDYYPTTSTLRISENPPYKVDDGGTIGATILVGRLNIGAPIFLGGEIIAEVPFTPYGGGIRVKNISLVDPLKTRTTHYEYFNGVTTYEPLGYAMPVNKLPYQDTYDCLKDNENVEIEKYRTKFVDDIFVKFKFLFTNSRELPGPGVLYEKVVVRETIERAGEQTEIPGRAEYIFEVFSPNTVDVSNSGHSAFVEVVKNSYGSPQSSSGNFTETPVLGLLVNKTQSKKVVISDYTAVMGSLKRMTLYDKDNNKVSETVNEYLHDNFSVENFSVENFNDKLLEKFSQQGLMTETFADARIIINETQTSSEKKYTLTGIVSQKVRYPSIQMSQTTTNFKTGLISRTENIGFDFYSGQQTKTLSPDANGNVFLTEIIPAYKAYPQMGVDGKNMLTQISGNYTYKVDAANPTLRLGLVSANVQTWSNELPAVPPGASHLSAISQPEIWRMSGKFDFVGNNYEPVPESGLYPISSVTPFGTWHKDDEATMGWRKTSSVNLYDVHSHALEAQDVNKLYASSLYSNAQDKILATAANCSYSEFKYSGFEEPPTSSGLFSGAIAKGQGQKDSLKVHTGKYSLRIGSNDTGINLTTRLSSERKKIRVSVWVHEQNASNVQLNYACYTTGSIPETSGQVDFQPDPEKKAGQWYLFEHEIPVPSNAGLQSGLNVYFKNVGSGDINLDDFRICPFESEMISYVYDEWGQLSYILGANGLFTKYEYDGAGRLTTTRRETFEYDVKKVSENKYHYAETN